ncbi:hypothetical protein RND61_28860 [Streptomyces sp. TRM76323]|uniref:Uncharacterized protein n=1 Tax=Streptomyces tamarix TaxID=3078565 RepID=A0ABU3QTI1_9ACTN|nr:hypothetical protein [Streptomyces tamarix]MDT9686052.1 hypothetical protein [Streptomyces tamarix]
MSLFDASGRQGGESFVRKGCVRRAALAQQGRAGGESFVRMGCAPDPARFGWGDRAAPVAHRGT